MSSGKGKGRATETDDVDNSSGPQDVSQPGNTLFDRVAASAAGLARSTFTAPNRNEINDGISAAQAGSGKQQQSSGSQDSAWAESSNPLKQSQSLASQGYQSASFRESHGEAHIASAEAEFSSFLDDIPSFEPSSKSHPHDQVLETTSFQNSTEQVNGQVLGYATIQEQQSHDGDAVLALLSDPHSEGIESLDVYKALDEDPVIWRLTAEQRAEWEKRLETDFPEAATHAAQNPYMPFNLVPTFETDPTRGAIYQDAYMQFGEEMSAEQARDEWIKQWDAVLYRYTDEVWGDLMPLVEEAREEVEAIKDAGSVNEQPKALRRLGLVLGHLRK